MERRPAPSSAPRWRPRTSRWATRGHFGAELDFGRLFRRGRGPGAEMGDRDEAFWTCREISEAISERMDDVDDSYAHYNTEHAHGPGRDGRTAWTIWSRGAGKGAPASNTSTAESFGMSTASNPNTPKPWRRCARAGRTADSCAGYAAPGGTIRYTPKPKLFWTGRAAPGGDSAL